MAHEDWLWKDSVKTTYYKVTRSNQAWAGPWETMVENHSVRCLGLP